MNTENPGIVKRHQDQIHKTDCHLDLDDTGSKKYARLECKLGPFCDVLKAKKPKTNKKQQQGKQLETINSNRLSCSLVKTWLYPLVLILQKNSEKQK